MSKGPGTVSIKINSMKHFFFYDCIKSVISENEPRKLSRNQSTRSYLSISFFGVPRISPFIYLRSISRRVSLTRSNL